MTEPTYPEHEKLKPVASVSQEIGDFLDWLGNEKGYTICEFHEEGADEYLPAYFKITELLAEYFGIDCKVLEQERRRMLTELRKQMEKDQ